MSYRIDVHGAAELEGQDPFEGRGRKVELPPGKSREERLAWLREQHGADVRFVAWDGCAWIDQEGSGQDIPAAIQ